MTTTKPLVDSPCRHPNVQFSPLPPWRDDERVIVRHPTNPDGKPLRLEARAARVLHDLDGTMTVAELATRHAAAYTDDAIPRVVALLRDKGYVAAAGEAAAVTTRPTPAWTALGRLSDSRHQQLQARLGWLLDRRTVVVAAGWVAACAILVVVRRAILIEQLQRGLGLGELIALPVCLLGMGVLHELSHAAVLVGAGGRLGGIRLRSFSGARVPVMVTETADALRLPRRAAITVYLAGPAASLLMAATLAAVAVALDLGPLPSLLAAFAAVSAAVNLVPLQELDGYLAVVALAGRLSLRREALDAWRSWLWDGSRPASRSLAVFGLASAASGPLLAATALCCVGTAMSWSGPLGRGAALGLVGLLVQTAVRAPASVVRRRRRLGQPVTRGAAAAAVLAAALLWTLTSVRVPLPASADFVRQTPTIGRVALPGNDLRAGDPVTLPSRKLWSPPKPVSVAAVDGRGGGIVHLDSRQAVPLHGNAVVWHRRVPLGQWLITVGVGV